VSSVQSIYRWKGKVCDENEALIIIKTTADKFESVMKRVKELHSYEVPEIVSISIKDGSKDYLDWIEKETG